MVERYSGCKHAWFPAGETMVKASDYDVVATELATLEAHAEDVEKSNLQLGTQVRALKAVLLNVRHTTMQTHIDCAYRLDAIYVLASTADGGGKHGEV